MASRIDARGFTLLEVLVAMTVLGIALLGSSIVMLAGLRASAAAGHRAAASALAQDLFERMRANPAAAAQYALEFDADPMPTSDVPCATGVPCDAGARAATDLAEWRESLRAVSATANARIAPTLGVDGTWTGVAVELRWLEAGGQDAQVFGLATTDED